MSVFQELTPKDGMVVVVAFSRPDSSSADILFSDNGVGKFSEPVVGTDMV